jgi:hypothetical protein
MTFFLCLPNAKSATNLGQSSDQTFTTSAAPDTTAPVISNISAVVGSTSATITWDTDEASSSLVEYGLSDSYGTSTTEADTSTRVTSHSVTLSGLTQQTTYHYRVKSNDASSNLATSIGGTFTTSRLITGGAVKFVVVDLVTGTRTPTQPATSTNEKITEPTVPIKDTVNKPALVFTKSLQTNATGDEVLKLQKLLNKLGYTVAKKGPGSPGNETKKFGAATRAALIRFQNANKKYVLTPAGLSKATGILGPYTRAYLNSLPEAQTLK